MLHYCLWKSIVNAGSTILPQFSTPIVCVKASKFLKIYLKARRYIDIQFGDGSDTWKERIKIRKAF